MASSGIWPVTDVPITSKYFCSLPVSMSVSGTASNRGAGKDVSGCMACSQFLSILAQIVLTHLFLEPGVVWTDLCSNTAAPVIM